MADEKPTLAVCVVKGADAIEVPKPENPDEAGLAVKDDVCGAPKVRDVAAEVPEPNTPVLVPENKAGFSSDWLAAGSFDVNPD